MLSNLPSLNSPRFFRIFIDLRKAFDAMDRERYIDIVVKTGVGQKAVRLIINFWEDGNLYCRMARYYGRVFKAKHGVTQDGPLSPTIFNLMVDAVVRAWLMEVEGSMDFADVHRLLAVFYTDDGLIVARNPAHLQWAFDSFCSNFDRVGMKTNNLKTKAMVFLPGHICICLTADNYEARMGNVYREER